MTDTREPAAAGVVLRRSRLVFPPAAEAGTSTGKAGKGDRAPVSDEAVTLLETRLLERGVLLSAPLRRALAALPSRALAVHARWLLGRIDKDLGADARHIPLFRGFPNEVPADTYELYVKRVFSLLLQEPNQPCVLCGEVGLVEALDPCAHLICRRCWDGANYRACPICNRHAASDGFFLTVPEARDAGPEEPGPDMPARTSQLGLGTDPRAAAGDLARRLLEREIPPTPAELEDLRVLSSYLGVADQSWLPAQIPVRAAKATVLGSLLADPANASAAAGLLARHLDSATDVLRMLYCLMGASADLTEPPARRRSLPRPLRTSVSALMDAMPFERLVQDLLRRRGKWLNAAEPLHPFADYRRRPRLALAFAILRRTRLDPATDFGRVLIAAASQAGGRVRLDGNSAPVFESWASEVETGLARQALPRVLELLAQRPGELVRRLAHVATLVETAWPDNGGGDSAGDSGIDVLARKLVEAVRHVSPGVLISALGALRTRTAASPPRERVFFPAGGRARTHIAPEKRAPLHPASVIVLCDVLERELDRRAAALPPVEHAVIDASLFDVIAPFASRSASASLVDLPRGSLQPLPNEGVVRLFLHWTQPEGVRVDLDLSVSVHAADWTFIDRCDYTNMRVGDDAAVHSGDLTDAPAPDGATEFVDLDPALLAELGARYAVAVVFSYNAVPFDQLEEGFAGYMLRRDASGPHFHPRTVEQRFDLHSQSRVALPLLLDLHAGTMRWLDMSAGATGTQHNLLRHEQRLAHLAAVLDAMFASGARVSMFELAVRHAAGRTRTVTVRGLDGTLHAFRRGDQESAAEFAARLLSGKSDGKRRAIDDYTGDGGDGNGRSADLALPLRPGLYLLGRCDLEIPERSTVYALHPGRLDATAVRTLTAADVLGSLAPDAPGSADGR